MNYEKKYNEALERAKKLKETCDSTAVIGWCEYIFPELRESEDGRIRKSLIALVTWASSYSASGISDVDAKEMLAWLEKQGKSSDQIHYWTEEEIEPIISDYLRGAEHYGGMIGRLRCLKPKSLKKQGEQKRQMPLVKSVPTDFKDRLGTFMQYTSVDLEKEENRQLLNEAAEELLQLAYSDKANEIALASAKTWEESMAILTAANNAYKKGKKEQKPAIEMKTPEESLGIDSDTYSKIVDECIYDEQNPADETEPKFKVGDWITNGIETVQITGYDIDYGYQVDYKGNLQHRDTDIIENEYHLWTIQDARNGDVLVDEDINVIGIFEGIEGMCWHSKFYYSNFTKEFYGIECGGSHQKEFAKPATKEQRDLLFQKMHEAGYEWNAEKKELKKIEQKPAWSEEDEVKFRDVIRLVEIGAPVQSIRDYYTNWLKSLKERLKGE